MLSEPIKRRLVTAASSAFLIGAAASCATATADYAPAPDVRPGPVMMITAGQGGNVLLPYYSAAPAPYALTGNGTRQTPEKSLRVLGPVYNAGQARILLPPGTP